MSKEQLAVQDKNIKGNGSDTDKKTPAFYSAVFNDRQPTNRNAKRSRSETSLRPIKFLNSIAQSASCASTRTYGWFSMTFGLVSLFLHLAEYYFSSSPSEELSQLVIGAVFALLSIPLMIVDIPICEAFQRFVVTDYILFEFFAIKRMSEDKNRKKVRSTTGIFFGLAAAVFGFFFPMEVVVLALAALLFAVVSFVSPEFPFLVMLMMVPYATVFEYSAEIMALISVLSLVSFFAKVMLGKRYCSFSISDFCIIVFSAVVIIFGVIGGGEDSTRISLVLVSLSLNYIPSTNIIVNRRLADCAIDAIVFSSLPVAVIAIAEYIVNLLTVGRRPASSVMSSPYILATYLCVILTLATFSIIAVHGSVKRGIYIAFLPVLTIALIATECIPVLIILPLLVVARSIMRSRNAKKELMLLLAVVPSLVFLLPVSVLSAISSLSPMSTALPELRAGLISAFETFTKSVFIGKGAADLSASAPSEFVNTILGLGCRFGIIAVIVLIAVCVIRLRQDTTYSVFLKSSQLSVFSTMTTVAMFAMLTCGWFVDVFADLGLYCLFFSLFGLNTAALRISKNEYEERAWYFRDQKDVDSSTADIFLHR